LCGVLGEVWICGMLGGRGCGMYVILIGCSVLSI
jgi:hypothetical protein